tara:strand:- start:3392 stop:4771 length:1380 start_codon:yes stop_codon:yes gene_type:complete
MMANVTYTNPAYDLSLPFWQKTRAAATNNGIKAGGQTYLPMGEDKDTAKYASYQKRAVYMGVTGRTQEALVGAIFRKELSFTDDLPSQLDFINTDFDGEMGSVEQVAKRTASDILVAGRFGYLVDFPAVGEMTREQEINSGVKPYTTSYSAENITNWETVKVNGIQKLALVVLKEIDLQHKNGDIFQLEEVTRYRVLRLVEGLYVQELYNDDGELEGEPIEPRMGGQRMTSIPFFFVGSVDNKPSVDEIPLEGIADINIAHYRNSADFEKNLYIHSGGTLTITTSMDNDAWKQMNPNGVVVGADQGLFLGDSGSASLLQLEPANAVDEAMKRKEQQMISIGARLITTSAINETAEAARIAASSETSVLNTVVSNIESALNQCLDVMAGFMGLNDAPEIKLNRQFFDTTLTAQEWMAANVAADRGDISQSDIRRILRKANILDSSRTDADIDNENGLNGQ